MTEVNGEFRHLEFSKRRGRRAPSDCGESLPAALNSSKYDIINGKTVSREYIDKFEGFQPDRQLNLFEGKDENEPWRLRKTVSEPRFSGRTSRPKVPDILSKSKLPDESLNKSYDPEFWSPHSSVAGDTESVYTIESLEDEFDGKLNLMPKYESPKHSMPKWYQTAVSGNGLPVTEPQRFEPPSAINQSLPSPVRYSSRQTNMVNQPPKQSTPKQDVYSAPRYGSFSYEIPVQSSPKNEVPRQQYQKYNRQMSDPPHYIDQDHEYESGRHEDQRTYILSNERAKQTAAYHEKAASSVSQQAYKRVGNGNKIKLLSD